MNADSSSRNFWRDLEELAAPNKFRARIRDEFLPGTSQPARFDRRNFLKVMGASLALAGLPACTRQPTGKIIPYVKQPENLVPGRPEFFATAMTLSGFATGLLVESHEGHPTKIEGNPAQPVSLGATNIFHQAALLDLYDAGRSQAVLNLNEPSTWNQFVAALTAALESAAEKSCRLRILTGSVSSPTLYHQIASLLKEYPQARWHQFDGACRDNVLAGALLAFGEPIETHYRFDQAKVVVSLDSDFLHTHPNSICYTRDFTGWRRASVAGLERNRLYVIESSPSITGSNADHRLPVKASEVADFAAALAGQIDGADVTIPGQERWLSAVKADLLENRGRSIVVAGENQPPIVHALAHQINHRLGNIGHTISFTSSALVNPVNQIASFKELCDALDDHEVDVLLILGGNPAFDAPPDFEFQQKITKAGFRAHLSSSVNETSRLCEWHIPENHFLESWSDARTFDGTVSIIQPLIIPMYDGKTVHEVLDAVANAPGRTDYEIVRAYWNNQDVPDLFEARWQRALRDGLIEGPTLPAKAVQLRPLDIPPIKAESKGLEITFRPDPNFSPGVSPYNEWLRELPQPVTKVVWDNPALVSPVLAKENSLVNGDLITLSVGDRRLRLPVWVTPGQPERSIALHLGNGSIRNASADAKSGFDVNPLRSSTDLWAAENVHLKKSGENYPLVTTQTLHAIDSEERQIFREGTFAEFQTDADFVQKNSSSPTETLFQPEEFKYDGYRWGMTIDLSACIGCNACILACQSENNIPVVGKTEVARGRYMHWIRVDTYFRGPPDNPEMNHQPVPCMHCENAPCELVCPVGATVHDKEGLNLQVYNRCIGTRYCSNNCPYKVRRFNFFQYADYGGASLKPMWNPNVTVRGRGVMEKCTYCVQRISAARINSEEGNRKITDGELKTACQQVCPAQAIVFGDLSDPQSQVSKLKAHSLNYSMLGELNTRPRTTYLAKLRNPNPDLSAT